MADVSDTRTWRPPRFLPRWSREVTTGGYALVAVAVALDFASGPGVTFAPMLAALPVLAGVGARRATVPLAAGVVASAIVAGLAVYDGDVPAVVMATAAATVVVVTFFSCTNVLVVTAQERELARVHTVAEAAQRALLRLVPRRMGPLVVAVRYVAAEAEARIGGDLYEVMRTPYGVRLCLGDVCGKGLAAVETAADVLGVFREAARAEPDLAQVARRLDSALARRPASEEFVTAVLVGIPDTPGPAVVVNCGHPPPLLCHGGRVSAVEPSVEAPPLALLGLVGGDYHARSLTFDRGDLLLLYTDGVSEARDAASRFYPLAQRVAALPHGEPDALLDELLVDVRAYVGSGLTDDAALLAVRRER
ncbi:PP2C family protein-serine/threonine phosphatase [Kitasatospora aureofaciens]|uniref:PP2C family protein-serine/threonine phosphatase n=1 Tax=Kitasatospora aureofaciens TaxID=1894 RepID=UPI0027DFD573|nr:PP2C family protein-serine/threonine phosphatase [Kitasatospora aureofaciens]